MPASAPRWYSYAEYLEIERGALERHEWFDGAILAMAGGTRLHARLKTRLTFLVSRALEGKRCVPYDSDLRVRVVASGLATYPDLSVICDAFIPDAEDRHAATNPSALFEVLSKDTAGYDHGEKFEHYKRIPTLRHYVLLDDQRPHLVLYTRLDDGRWARSGHDAGSSVDLPEIGVTLDVDEVYAGFEEEWRVDGGSPVGS
jgi:Uma2 family endonuclease